MAYTLNVLPIRIEDFAADGVSLTPATDPDFDVRAQTILDGRAAPMLELKPCLAIVLNQNPRTVVAYTVTWTTTNRNDTTERRHTQFKFPDAVAGTGNGLAVLRGREIRPGEQRLVGMGFEAWPAEYVDSYRDFGMHEWNRMSGAKELCIALDAVIFDDGALLGPDESNLAEHFIAYVQAKQMLYHDVVVGLENSSLHEDVFAPLQKIAAPSNRPLPMDPLAIYPGQAAAEILAWHNRILLEVFRRTLRREAFTIKRQ